MKPTYLKFATAVALATTLAATSVHAESKKEDPVTYEQVSDYTVEQKTEAVTWLEERADDLDRQIDELDQKMANAGDAMAAKWEEVKIDLAAKREAVARDLEEFKNASADAWDSAKASMVESMQDMERAYDAAAEELSK
tara:strand:+ start:11955 stop:12371 length:417 start_codon:yes stop_codon:yes gene_type:complete